ncbi:MAG: rod shape-determining protein MreC [Candidatus Limnocylindrales bacterium]|jgi:rod shape-determining protein MreC
MNARSGYRLPRGQWVVFGLLLTLSIGMMGASGTRFVRTVRDDVNFMLNPVEGWVNDTADTVGSYWFTLTQLDHVRSENQQLREENQTLKEELARMPGIARLNDNWTKISQAQQTSPYQPIIARVVVRDISDVRPRTIVINRGLADGVALGQVIIDAGGALVGRVQSVETYDAVVLLVNDSSAVVIGSEEESGATGTIHGQVGGLLLMSYVSSSDKLANGQAVVTTGMVMPGGDVRSPYPPGLLIGTIIKVSKDPNQVVQSAVVQPAADLNGIEWVLVITNYQGGFSTPGPSASPSPSPSSSLNPTPKAPPATPSATPPATPTATPTPGLVTPPPH